MKIYYNKAQPILEYGMLSSGKLNNPHRKPKADGLVTYCYTSVKEPHGGPYLRNGIIILSLRKCRRKCTPSL